MLMTTKLLDEHPDPDDETIKHHLNGNLCRCATYPEVLDAVRLASRKRRTLNGVQQHAPPDLGAI
jgi:carbon-monoxide dehydrogenase small subunit